MKKYLQNTKKIRERKSVYEELLERNRRRLAKIKQPKSIYEGSKLEQEIGWVKRSTYETVFKSIGHRKSYRSLGIAMNYILKETCEDCLENELGEDITRKNMQEEIKRFALLKDEENVVEGLENRVKAPKLDTELAGKNNKADKQEDHLKNRQIWHCMLSLPNDRNDPQEFKDAMRIALADILIGHKYMFAVHTDTKQHHCHIVVKSRNDYDNKIIRTSKALLASIHQRMNDICHQKGLNLEKPNKEYAKLPNFLMKQVPNWTKAVRDNEFNVIDCDKKSKTALNKMGLRDNSLIYFLQMYKENPTLAISSLEKNPKLFKLNNPIILNKKIDIKIIENGKILAPNLLQVYENKVPKWKEMYLEDSFKEIRADENTTNRLKEIGMDEKNIKSFLNMYEEDKNLAVWTVNNRSNMFEIEPVSEFTLRKVRINPKEKQEEIKEKKDARGERKSRDTKQPREKTRGK